MNCVALKRQEQMCGWTFMKIPTALLALQMKSEKKMSCKKKYLYRILRCIVRIMSSSVNVKNLQCKDLTMRWWWSSVVTLLLYSAFSIHAKESNYKKIDDFVCTCVRYGHWICERAGKGPTSAKNPKKIHFKFQKKRVKSWGAELRKYFRRETFFSIVEINAFQHSQVFTFTHQSAYEQQFVCRKKRNV